MHSIDRYAAELLRRQRGRTLTLQQLHELLVHELGPGAGTYQQLHHRLKQTAGRLRVLERTDPLGDQSWPAEIRQQYLHALEDAGVDTSPIVSLLPANDDETSVLDDLRATLLNLSDQLQQDALLRDEVIAALSQLPGLQERMAAAEPTTIPPRDPPR